MNDSELKRALGRLMVTGLPAGPLTPEWERRIADLAPAGVILFRRNVPSVEVLRDTTQRLHALADAGGFAPLWICADEEGGFLSPVLGLDEPAPAAMALGVADSEDLAFRVAKETGSRLRELGLNLNLAPCLDVNDEPANPVIGPRSFGSDTERVARLGVQTVRGLRSGGVLATGKHFPGHGSTTRDSHKVLPVDARSVEEIRSRSLAPFAAAVGAGVDLIMTAHVGYPSLTGVEDEPATFSRYLIEDLLREELGFKGPVITDALEMAAVADRCPAGAAALESLDAGADVLLFTRGDDRPREARDELLRAVDGGRLAEDRIARSRARIQNAKISIPEPVPPGRGQLFSEARERGIAILDDPGGLIPLNLGPGETLAILVPDPGLPEGAIDCAHLESEIRSRHPRTKVFVSKRGEPPDPDALRSCDLALVFTLSRGPLDSWQQGWAREACDLSGKTVLVAAFNPHAVPMSARPVTRVATHDFGTQAMSSLVARLFAAC